MNDPTNDQMMNTTFLPWQSWSQQAMWLELLRPFLYCLLAVALICLVLTLIDLAMLCWRESDNARTRFNHHSRAAFPAPTIKRFQQWLRVGR